MPSTDRGHAMRAHTADVVIEAWGPTASACYEEAVAAFVSVFAGGGGRAGGGSPERFEVGPGGPTELLVLLLEEALFDADARGLVPVGAEVEVRGDRLAGTFACVPAEQVAVTGSIPKGISYSELEFGPCPGGWRCRATVDV